MKKKLFLMFIGILLINSGCEKQNSSIQKDEKLEGVNINITTTQKKEEIKVTTTKKESEEQVDNISETQKEEAIIDNKEEVIESTNNVQVMKFNNETELLNYVNEIPNTLSNYINKENLNAAKDFAIEKFIQIVDFLCYDKELGGIKFSELTDSAKKEVINIFNKIDGMIENKFPDYKETIKQKTGETYDYISNIVITKKQQLENYIENKVGKENYEEFKQELEEVNEDTKETLEMIKDAGSKIGTTIKEKYENLRENYSN